jgi:hypothetical protein
VRPSTLLELAGFGLISYAAYSWNEIVGLAIAGGFLVLIGYGTADEAFVSALKRPFRRRQKG